MYKKVTTLVALGGGTVALLNYFRKVNEEDSLKITLAMVCALSTKLKGVVHDRDNIL